MAETFTDFDPATYLTSQVAIAEFIADALETKDTGYFANAISVAALAAGKTALQSGCERNAKQG